MGRGIDDSGRCSISRVFSKGGFFFSRLRWVCCPESIVCRRKWSPKALRLCADELSGGSRGGRFLSKPCKVLRTSGGNWCLNTFPLPMMIGPRSQSFTVVAFRPLHSLLFCFFGFFLKKKAPRVPIRSSHSFIHSSSSCITTPASSGAPCSDGTPFPSVSKP